MAVTVTWMLQKCALIAGESLEYGLRLHLWLLRPVNFRAVNIDCNPLLACYTLRMDGYVCGTCGKKHDGNYEAYTFGLPWQWTEIPVTEQAERCVESQDVCMVDKTLFVRGVIGLPINGTNRSFYWVVWARVDPEEYETFSRMLDDPHDPSLVAPMQGWISNKIEIYPDTMDLLVKIFRMSAGMRPHFKLIGEIDHPLIDEHRRGITAERWTEISTLLQHEWQHPEWNRSLGLEVS